MIESLPVSRPTQKGGSTLASRVTSIDILRALTMVLMIFVNDLWSLKNIPAWLGHVERGVDGIGLADVVFPAFLFIVGLSLPYAIDARRKKGDNQGQLLLHVIFRTIALLVMGLFLVNGESINAKAMGIPRYVWYPACCLCFILIWNVYPKTTKKGLVYLSRAIGIGTLVTLAILYRGGDGTARFAPHWWGILGLIGWAYLASGIITVLAKNKLPIIIGAWIFFSVLSMLAHAQLLPDHAFFRAIPDAIRGGTLTGLTLGGVLTALIFQHYQRKKNNAGLTVMLLSFAGLLIVLSLITRPHWKLAKLGATPAWLFLCSAFTILAFLAVYWIADVGKKANWFKVIKPAGTDTLLCYLIPYFMYALVNVSGMHLPDALVTGGIGLLKSFLFALLCVAVTGLLNRGGVKLRL